MRCNGENCLSIANEYKNKIGSLSGSLNSMKGNINNISNSLNSLNIPDDYIGNKVVKKLESIYNDLTASAENVNTFNSQVSGFVDQKITEHQNHYHAWKRKQEELAAMKKEKENNSEE